MENSFYPINNFHQNIKFTLEEESNRELAFLDTALKRNHEKISKWVYRMSTLTAQYNQVATKWLFPPCLIEHIPLSKLKLTYTKKTLE